MQFGKRLWICPSWRDVPDENAVNVMLDPGLAFGTGTHPTTSLCLQWLDGLDLDGKTVIDFGCGSGIRDCRPETGRGKSYRDRYRSAGDSGQPR
jgi:ribosomal protein L11 methyltransferase